LVFIFLIWLPNVYLKQSNAGGKNQLFALLFFFEKNVFANYRVIFLQLQSASCIAPIFLCAVNIWAFRAAQLDSFTGTFAFFCHFYASP